MTESGIRVIKHFDFKEDILYLAAHTTSGQYLYKCDENTGECTLYGKFPPIGYFCVLTIPYNGEIPKKPEIKGPYFGRRELPNKFTVENECNASRYKWDWGDGNWSWNKTNNESYSWVEIGTNNISTLARNVYGESDWSDPICVQIKDFNFNKAFIFGYINFLNITENLTTIESDSILYFGKPVYVKWFNSGERIVISETMIGRIKSNLIFGFFKADIIG